MDTDRQVEITDAHRVMATRAHGNGRVVVLDRGPREPVDHHIEVERTDAEIEADNRRHVLEKREYDDWHKLHDGPVALEMFKVDADHAVNSDPDRYVHVPRGIRAPVTLDERVARLEQRLGPETAEEVANRKRGDRPVADQQAQQPDETVYE